MWKKVAESKDLIILENSLKDHKLKIEARKKSSGWEVFHTKIKGENSSLLSEFVLDNKTQVQELIEKLKRRNAPVSVINDTKTINIYMKRAYKEDYVEKWLFYIGDNKNRNVVIVKYGDIVNADIIMEEKLIYLEKAIISQIEDRLGLKDAGREINYEVFYYKRHSIIKKNTEPEYNMDLMDIEFGFPPDDEN